MSLFVDKKFESLDWFSQITEMIDCDLNDILADLPNEIEVTMDMIKKESYSYNKKITCSALDFIQPLVRDSADRSSREMIILRKCFEFKINPDMVLNFEDNTMSHKLFLVKTKNAIEDSDLISLLAETGISELSDLEYQDGYNVRAYQKDIIKRMNVILQIISDNESDPLYPKILKSRSKTKKFSYLKAKLRKILENNLWRIRSVSLAKNVGHWIMKYIAHNNHAALLNLKKVKAITHDNVPIYSIEEEAV